MYTLLLKHISSFISYIYVSVRGSSTQSSEQSAATTAGGHAGAKGQQLKRAVRNILEAAERASW